MLSPHTNTATDNATPTDRNSHSPTSAATDDAAQTSSSSTLPPNSLTPIPTSRLPLSSDDYLLNDIISSSPRSSSNSSPSNGPGSGSGPGSGGGFSTSSPSSSSRPEAPLRIPWTEEEDDLLRMAVEQHSGRNWNRIAAAVGNSRTDIQCLHRWVKKLKPRLTGPGTGPWTKEEDQLLIDLVNKHGPKRWSIIAASLHGRIGKQCRERYATTVGMNE